MNIPMLRLKDKFFLVIVGLVLIFSLVSRLFHRSEPIPDQPTEDNTVQVMIHEENLTLETASTPESMVRGLGGRDFLDQAAGMMFLHATPGIYQYEMREMRFGLDFLFVRGDRIVDIAERVPQTFRGMIAGAVDYDTVIEVNSGWVAAHQVKIGDQVVLIDKKQ